MKVRIGNIWYTSDDMPILVIMNDEEADAIGSNYYNFAAFPADPKMSKRQKDKFLRGEDVKL